MSYVRYYSQIPVSGGMLGRRMSPAGGAGGAGSPVVMMNPLASGRTAANPSGEYYKNGMTTTFLLVDDDVPFRSRLARALASRGFVVHEAGDVEEGLAVYGRVKPHRVVVDLKMPGKTGLDFVDEASKIDPDAQIVVLTGYGSIATAVDAVHRGALDYLQKPADADEVIAVFERDEEKEVVDEGTAGTTPSLARVEWEHIQRILHDCDGNISQAARRLGIHRRSLQRKLGKMPPLE
jgi:two-component system response regulator RegA